MSAVPQTAAEKALAERDRIARLANAAKRRELARLYADDQWGERLRKFGATLNHFGIEHSDEMIAYVGREARWLRHEAPDEIRHAALHLIGERIQRIRARAGLVPFDDPLPDEDPDVFQLCKQAISP